MILTKQKYPKGIYPRGCRPLAPAAGLAVAALIGCAVLARGQAAAPAMAVTAPPVAEPVETPANPQPSVTYRMKPKDVVHVMVFEEPDLTVQGKIDDNGTIFFPMVGQAKIGGQTVEEATATMVALLHKYLVHPQVSIEIVSYAKEHFTILGEVNKPGIFDMPDETSLNLLEALGMAGGYTKIANPSKITVKRYVSGQETVIKIDGKKLMDPHNASAPVFQVEPGDTIHVGEAIF
jgi:protein involved in polysaccharide export with SLBB domain